MRIALCLSGQPRFVKQGFDYFKKNVFDVNDTVDVFAFLWWDPSKIGKLHSEEEIAKNDPRKTTVWQESDLEDFKTCYGPWLQTLETDLEFDIDVFPPEMYETWGQFTREVCSMFYSYKKVNELKTKYEIKNNFKYDWVIRSRPDFAINKPIDFSELDNNKLYIPDTGIPRRHNFAICNNFGFSSSEIMDTYCEIFDNLEDYVLKNGCRLDGGESTMFHHLYRNGFETEKPGFENLLLPNKHDRYKLQSMSKDYRSSKLPIMINQTYLKGYNGYTLNYGDAWIIRKY